MAAKTFYFKDAVPSGATLHRSLQDGGTAPTAATTGIPSGYFVIALYRFTPVIELSKNKPTILMTKSNPTIRLKAA